MDGNVPSSAIYGYREEKFLWEGQDKCLIFSPLLTSFRNNELFPYHLPKGRRVLVCFYFVVYELMSFYICNVIQSFVVLLTGA